MKHLRRLLPLCFILVILGCGDDPQAKDELERTAEIMAETPPPPPAPQAEPANSGIPPNTELAPAEPTVAPAQEVRQALVEYKSGKLEDAVTRLQKLRSVRTLTAEQRMALQDSVAAVMNEVYDLAARGDPKAIQAVRQYEEMQSGRR